MNLQKLLLIIKREYLTRIRTKTFIISTILAPIIILGFILVPIYLATLKTEKIEQFSVVDYTHEIAPRLEKMNQQRYLNTRNNPNIDSLKNMVRNGKIEGYLIIDESVLEGRSNPELFTSGSIGIILKSEIESDIKNAIRNTLLSKANVDNNIRNILSRSITLTTTKLTKEGEQEENTDALFVVGYIMAFMIYFAMLAYGGLTMRSVVEEKTNRIVEIIASSAKPFELLLGKVVGVGALGFTQFVIWAISISGISTVIVPFFMRHFNTSAASNAAAQVSSAGAFHMPAIGLSLWIYFILFFILGYLMYSSLFAAIGSAVDSESDVQQLTFPITICIILPILFLSKVAGDPDSTFAVITSLVPLFTPILMIARLAVTNVPLWQSLGSLILTGLTFILFMWISARIYRVGILMYGKKPNLKEIAKWVRYR